MTLTSGIVLVPVPLCCWTDFSGGFETLHRKNAVLAVASVYQTHKELIPDAPDQLYRVLQTVRSSLSSSFSFFFCSHISSRTIPLHTHSRQEANISAKRNAFVALMKIDLAKTALYLNSVLDSVGNAQLGEPFELIILEAIRRICAPTASSSGAPAGFPGAGGPAAAPVPTPSRSLYVRAISNLVSSRMFLCALLVSLVPFPFLKGPSHCFVLCVAPAFLSQTSFNNN